MKRRLIRILALMSVLSVVLPFQVAPTEKGSANPFFMWILDEQVRESRTSVLLATMGSSATRGPTALCAGQSTP